MRVGFIGAGRMGAPMVRRLTTAGHQVRALGRDDEKRTAVAELGAEPVSSAREAVEDADVTIVCVFTDEQVRDLCPDLIDEMSEGSVLVLHTTGSPRTAEALAERGAPRGITVVDAPVSGGPHDIAAGTVTVFAGGDEAAVARAREVLTAYADPVLHVGPVGSGQRVKLVNNALFAAQIGVVAEGVRLGERLGIDEATLLTALTHGSAASRALGGIAATGSADAFIERVGEFIGKDVAVVRGTASELNSDLGRLEGLLDAATK
ncbi:6-phosphogluconate dehydrogenase [Mycolicibacterium conceptionense]|jgi:3-hydroxyisobutyrate dehydrogenase-like beta-hydroxyacid dehydrogenase|uniref:6-phosphogluconate dehydrogenase n=3 Tax=Mycolicibacterium TaxID=1866885 RepID=A0ABR5FPP9_9MYCO|nr:MULTISPECIES: NAD(P)-dependent oxidoreductase [Mycolicibacterium]KLI08263.1 6-phosphogluconate dehydrogenase [Mycolicibacterium senegalense]KLO48815.1 6-phosphogluconate dehydrogenase [Mycolicibacterium senegalense]KMV16959.1 6-phosphogluconate dehydrogenase [Mycolicibacterium conceptionense]OBJ93062.1 6-phosphogluconate dehydrogenase [Mycolicibacterium conceptionense]OMB69803.1 6-phosphogluconate dehydrogenase [Mycolicibacterium conceptionense]